MIKKIQFPQNFKKSQIMLFETADLTKMKNPKIVPLFGPNGAGKTTLLQTLRETLQYETHLAKFKDDKDFQWYKKQIDIDLINKGCIVEKDNKPYLVAKYSNVENNFKDGEIGTNTFDPYLINSRFEAKTLSEGQSIVYSIYHLFDLLKPGKNMLQCPDGELFVFIDELDSGLSIDNLDMFMRKLKYILRKRDDIQIFFSFNNPRCLSFFPEVLSMYDGNIITLHSTEDMLEEIRKHKKEFNKLRKMSNGMPRIPN